VVNYVAPEAVPCAFLAEPAPQRHITPNATEEITIDGYRAIAVKSDGVNLYSLRKKSFNSKFPYIAEALADMPPRTVVDGELVAIDENGRPNFNLLQKSADNYFLPALLSSCHDSGATIEGRTLLSVSSKESGRFTREHLRLAKSLALSAAVAIQNARLYERAEIYASELELQVKLLKETQAALEQTQSRSRGTGS
jgi:ATP dependent DNA ligase-like protein